jgi:hypothetical protein
MERQLFWTQHCEGEWLAGLPKSSHSLIIVSSGCQSQTDLGGQGDDLTLKQCVGGLPSDFGGHGTTPGHKRRHNFTILQNG